MFGLRAAPSNELNTELQAVSPCVQLSSSARRYERIFHVMLNALGLERPVSNYGSSACYEINRRMKTAYFKYWQLQHSVTMLTQSETTGWLNQHA